MVFVLTEAVPQLLLAPKISLLFGFEALFAFLFLPILDCWTASDTVKLLVVAKTIEEGIKGIKEELAHIWADYILANERELNGDAIKFKNDLIDCPLKHEDLIRILAGKNKI